MNRLYMFAAGMLIATSAVAQVTPPPSLMNFQGRLATPSGNPVPDGNYTIQFSLFNALTGGTLVWQRSLTNVPVKNGTFAVKLDFSGGFQNSATLASVFGASAVFLETKIGADTPLAPRQQLLTVPYAMKANSVPDGSITTSSILDGTILAADLANGTITADKFATGIFNPLAWLLTGNSATNPATQFLGTTDNQPLAFRVNNRQAMRYQYAENTASAGLEYRSVNILGGSDINSIRAGVVGATLAGGGLDNFSIIDFPNRVTDEFGTVGGGGGNEAGNNNADLIDARFATVAGGINNNAGGFAATVPGGSSNVAGANYSFAAGQRAKANHLGAFVWADASDLTTDFASTGNNQFLIRASGVGINKNNPATALDVAGTATVTGFVLPTGAADGRTLISNAGGTGTWGQIGSAGIADNAVTGAKIANGTITADKFASAAFGWFLNGNAISDPATQFLGTTTNQPLVFRTNNTEKLRLAANGNLGLGTSTPLTKLHIQDGAIRFGNEADAKNYDIAYDSTGDYFYIDEFGAGRRLVIKNGGNIGIGTTNPQAPLQVNFAGQTDTFQLRFDGFTPGINMTGPGNLAGILRFRNELQVWPDDGGTRTAKIDIRDNSGNSKILLPGSGNATFMQGNVGVGTTAPTALLHVNGGDLRVENGGINVSGNGVFAGISSLGNIVAGGRVGIGTEMPDKPLTVQANAGGTQWLGFKNNSGVTKWHLNHDGGGLNFTETDIADFRLFLAAGGNVGVGTNAPSHKFTVQGGTNTLRLIGPNGASLGFGAKLNFGDGDFARIEEYEDDKLKIKGSTVLIEGTFINNSDARYKQNIAVLDNALDSILNLRGVSYDWKEEFAGKKYAPTKQIGFIAQEMEQVLPELVYTDTNGYKAVAYLGVIPVLVESVKTLNARTIQQQKQNDSLKAENAELRARLDRIEAALNLQK